MGGVWRKRCHEAILLSPLEPILFPFFSPPPAHSFLPPPGPHGTRGTVYSREYARYFFQDLPFPKHSIHTRARTLLFTQSPHNRGADWDWPAFARPHSHGCTSKSACTEIHTHIFLGRLPCAKTKYQSLVSLSCE